MIEDRPLTKTVTPTLGVPIIANIDAGSADEIKVFYGDSEVAIQDSDYTIVVAGDFKSVTITPLLGLITKVAGGQITIAYEAPIVQPWVIPASPVLPEGEMEAALDRATLAIRRVYEKIAGAMRLTTNGLSWDALDKKIVNVANATSDHDAVNLAQLQALLAQVASGDLPNLATLITYAGAITGANVSAALNNIATMITDIQNSIIAIGTGALAGGLLTGALDYKSIIAVDSAATADIGAVNGNRILLNGVVTITSFGAGVEKFRIIRHNGVHQLTAGANLIPPNAADIVVEVGDISAWVSDAAAVWRCTFYTRANGRPVRVLLADITNMSANARTMNAAADFAAIKTALGLGDLASLNQTSLVYTGSNKDNTSFPIGSIVAVVMSAVANRNASSTVRLDDGTDTRFSNTGTGTALAGTWRARGTTSPSDSVQLFQRVA